MPKKKNDFMDDTNPIDEGQGKAHASQLGSPSLRDIDAIVYGGTPAVVIPESGGQYAEALPLEWMIPDPAQPRRAIPHTVKEAARADGISEWKAWHRIAEQLHGKKIDLPRLLRGEGEASELDPLGIPLVEKFFEFVGLALSIRRDKLTNPINVVHVGPNRYRIEAGERRWQAHWMLLEALGEDQFNRIAANIVDQPSVWKQATENNSRLQLNAIERSRQLALLVMDLYRGKDSVDIYPFHKIVPEGACDRAFYAQVSHGRIYSIPTNMTDKTAHAIGLKSKSQISQYRRLLEADDDLWLMADENDWTEGKIREEMQRRENPGKLTTVNSTPQSVNPLQTSTHQNGDSRPPLNNTVIRKMRYGSMIVGYIRTDDDGTARVQLYDSAGDPSFQQSVPVDSLKDLTPPAPVPSPFDRSLPPTISTAIKQDAGLIGRPTTPSAPSAPSAPKIVLGQIYKHRTGIRRYEVIGLQGDSVSCYEVNGAGKRITPAPFPMKIENLDALTPLIPDLMGKRIFHHLGAYRYEGVVTDLKWDQGSGDYIVKLRTDEGKIEGPFLSKNVRVTGPTAAPTQPSPAPESAAPEIKQHRKTQKLYIVVSPLPGNWVRAVEVHETGEQLTGAIEALRLDDLLPYEGESVDQAAEMEGPRLPERQEEMLIALYRNAPYTKNPATRFALEGRGMITIVNREAWDIAINTEGYVYLKKIGEISESTLIGGAEAADTPPSIVSDQEIPLLPDWIYEGACIRHIASEKPCFVQDATFDEPQQIWILRVSVAGEIAYAPQGDFEEKPPHLALNPKNMNGVITELQHLMGRMGEVARFLEMVEAKPMIIGTQTLTASGIRDLLHHANGDAAQVQAHFDTLRAGDQSVIARAGQAVDDIYFQFCEVLADYVKKQRGAS